MTQLKSYTLIGAIFVTVLGTLSHFFLRPVKSKLYRWILFPNKRIHLGTHETSLFPHAAFFFLCDF